MLFELLGEKERKNEPFALLTPISTSGTVSRKSGRMAVFKDGSFSGTIGGGESEKEAIKIAQEAIQSGLGGVRDIWRDYDYDRSTH